MDEPWPTWSFCILLPNLLVISETVATIIQSERLSVLVKFVVRLSSCFSSAFSNTVTKLAFTLSCKLLLSLGSSVLPIFCSAIYFVYSLYLKSEKQILVCLLEGLFKSVLFLLVTFYLVVLAPTSALLYYLLSFAERKDGIVTYFIFFITLITNVMF